MKIISEEAKIKIKNRHHSIKTQMIMAFVGLLICLVVTLMFINGNFWNHIISVRRNHVL